MKDKERLLKLLSENQKNEQLSENRKLEIDGKKYEIKRIRGGFGVYLNEGNENKLMKFGSNQKSKFETPQSAQKVLNSYLQEQKFVLKTPKTANPQNPIPQTLPPVEPQVQAPVQNDMEGAMDGSDMPEMDGEEGLDTQIDTEADSNVLKSMAGKLAYQFREYQGEDYSSDVKYTLNSILAALDFTKVDEDDKADIAQKLQDVLQGQSQDEEGQEDVASEEQASMGDGAQFDQSMKFENFMLGKDDRELPTKDTMLKNWYKVYLKSNWGDLYRLSNSWFEDSDMEDAAEKARMFVGTLKLKKEKVDYEVFKKLYDKLGWGDE